MRILGPLVSGIATGIGMKLGSDIYDRVKAKVATGDMPKWAPGRRDEGEDARPVNPWRPGEVDEADAAAEEAGAEA